MDPAEREAGGAPALARCSRITFITLFPEIINVYFTTSIVARARSRGAYRLDVVDLNRYRIGATRQCDDAPYGGGAGMLLRPEPLAAAIDSVTEAAAEGGAGITDEAEDGAGMVDGAEDGAARGRRGRGGQSSTLVPAVVR